MKIVTAAIIVDNGRVMITRRREGEKLAGSWEFPGGKVESGETLQSCLARELKEELGLDAEIGAVLAESDYEYEHGAIRLIALRAHILNGTPALTVHDKLEWVRPEDLLGFPMAAADIPIAKRLVDIL